MGDGLCKGEACELHWANCVPGGGELHKQARWPDGPCLWPEALIDAGRTTACTIWVDKDTHSAYVRTWYTHTPTHKHTHTHNLHVYP